MVVTTVTYRFESVPSQALTDKAYELQIQGAIHAELLVQGEIARLVASGECPRCGGHFTVDRSSEVPMVKGGTLGVGDEADGYEASVVTCNGPEVEGTPPGKQGCGACFSVYARKQGGNPT